MTTKPVIYPLSDSAITIQFGEEIAAATHDKVMNLFQLVRQQPFSGMLDVIPAYTTLTIIINPDIFYGEYPQVVSAFQWVSQYVHALQLSANAAQQPVARRLEVPVCYHPSMAPDLEIVARQHRLTTDEVIHLHCSTSYHVYLLGFLPGFPYMGIVDEKIATPRKQSPGKNVAAGSVGIADNQTGIYPFASPGGWQLIGQTPLLIFDIKKQKPAFFKPGDEVRFFPISLEEFNQSRQHEFTHH